MLIRIDFPYNVPRWEDGPPPQWTAWIRFNHVLALEPRDMTVRERQITAVLMAGAEPVCPGTRLTEMTVFLSWIDFPFPFQEVV